jgi:glycosyltransferase involved in cell wall biosynthesis
MINSSSMSKTILFISHDASRTGAPIYLLNFLRWLKENTDIPFQILLKKGGSLEPEFREIAPTLLYTPKPTLKSRITEKILKRLKLYSPEKQLKIYQQSLIQKLAEDNIGLIYANTSTVGDVLKTLEALNCPTICHIHELDYWIRHRVGMKKFETLKNHTTHFIAVSEAVKKNLVENHNIADNIIHINYPFVRDYSPNKGDSSWNREDFLKQNGIPENAKVICASGTLDWRKSPDIFVLLARTITEKYTDYPVHFIWVGGTKKSNYFNQLWYDVQKLKLDKLVHFVGVQLNPLDYFTSCDVFVLTSREDPYPLVCLEAALVGKPIVCFDDAGGEKEFVEDDCGFVIPYLDIEVMATKIIKLLDSSELCQNFGQQAQQKVQQRHNINVAAKEILTIIEKVMLSG